MIFILSCWLFHIPVHFWPIAFYSIYTLNPHHLSASNGGHQSMFCIDHRGEIKISKLQSKRKVRRYCTSCDKHYKSTHEKSISNMAQNVFRNKVWKLIPSFNWVLSDKILNSWNCFRFNHKVTCRNQMSDWVRKRHLTLRCCELSHCLQCEN